MNYSLLKTAREKNFKYYSHMSFRAFIAENSLY